MKAGNIGTRKVPSRQDGRFRVIDYRNRPRCNHPLRVHRQTGRKNRSLRKATTMLPAAGVCRGRNLEQSVGLQAGAATVMCGASMGFVNRQRLSSGWWMHPKTRAGPCGSVRPNEQAAQDQTGNPPVPHGETIHPQGSFSAWPVMVSDPDHTALRLTFSGSPTAQAEDQASERHSHWPTA